MSTTLPPYSIMMEGRVRRSCESLEWQTSQSHPSVGTPIDVPLPSTVRVAFILLSLPAAGSRCRSRLRRPRQRVRHFNISHAQFVEAVLQEILFMWREI